MRVECGGRGFHIVLHEKYPPGEEIRLIQESSAIDFNYENGLSHPGSSYLWVGDNHHLNREEVKELIKHMKRWLKTGCLGENK
jgi:hypothetical protein